MEICAFEPLSKVIYLRANRVRKQMDGRGRVLRRVSTYLKAPAGQATFAISAALRSELVKQKSGEMFEINIASIDRAAFSVNKWIEIRRCG